MNDQTYDALFLVSFGGPEGKDDVMPYLENVLRGKNVPRERMLEVAEHYYHFDGISPINEQNRNLLAAIRDEFKQHNVDLPVYWGNRNWHPMIVDTVREMKDAGIQKSEDRRSGTKFLFTAHSIPNSMADFCKYSKQLTESCRLIMESIGPEHDWELVYQSRSGPPHQPWLEPDVCDRINELKKEGTSDILIHPVGFVSDHMEVLFDLDTEAKDLCDELGINMVRSLSVGVHPKFVSMIRELVLERIGDAEKRAIGSMPAPMIKPRGFGGSLNLPFSAEEPFREIGG